MRVTIIRLTYARLLSIYRLINCDMGKLTLTLEKMVPLSMNIARGSVSIISLGDMKGHRNKITKYAAKGQNGRIASDQGNKRPVRCL